MSIHRSGHLPVRSAGDRQMMTLVVCATAAGSPQHVSAAVSGYEGIGGMG